MCIACYSPAGVPVPSLEILKACADSNGDGCGISYPCVGGKVQILKGFQSAEEVHEALHAQDFTNVPIFIHFRIGTHGLKTDAKHTHPFPIGATTEVMEKLVHQCDHAVMHNGIMNAFGYEKAISDTMAFARDFLGHVINHIDNQGVQAAINGALSWDKLAIMMADGRVYRFGKWIESDGIFYSNESFRTFGGADPRKWGSCSTWSKGWGDRLDTPEDDTQDFVDYRDELDKFRPWTGQLWSEGLTLDGKDTIDNFDESHLLSDCRAAQEFGAALDVPRPTGCSEVEFDAWVVCKYLTKAITDTQLIGYLETGVLMRKAEAKKTRRINRKS